MTASTKSQRITKEQYADPQTLPVPAWYWSPTTADLADYHWFRRVLPFSGVAVIVATHWHPDQPDAPQEVPDADKWVFGTADAATISKNAAESRAALHGPCNALPNDPTHQPGAINPNAKLSPAPSKETIAREAAEEVVSLFPGSSDSSCIEQVILRALDRAGEAKGADDTRILDWIGDPNAPTDRHDEIEKFLTEGGDYREAVALAMMHDGQPPLRSAPRPPASVDAGTPRTDAETMEHTCEDGFHCIEMYKGGTYVKADFARTLERELNATLKCAHDAVKECKDAQCIAREAMAQLSSLAVQLEEAKERVRVFAKVADNHKAAETALRSALAEKEKERDRVTQCHVTCWKALRRAAATFRWLDAYSHKECAEDTSAVDAALKLTPTESGGYTVILGTELDQLRARLAALEEDKRRDREALEAVRVISGRIEKTIPEYHYEMNLVRAALSSENPRTLREGEEKP